MDHKKGWAPEKWCFQIVVLEKTLESPLDSKVIKLVNPKGNQSWIFIKDWCWSWNSDPLATWCREFPWCCRVRLDLATEQKLYLNFRSVQVREVGGNNGGFFTETCTHEAGCTRRYIWGKYWHRYTSLVAAFQVQRLQCLILNGYLILSCYSSVLNGSTSAYLFSTSCNTVAA